KEFAPVQERPPCNTHSCTSVPGACRGGKDGSTAPAGRSATLELAPRLAVLLITDERHLSIGRGLEVIYAMAVAAVEAIGESVVDVPVEDVVRFGGGGKRTR